MKRRGFFKVFLGLCAGGIAVSKSTNVRAEVDRIERAFSQMPSLQRYYRFDGRTYKVISESVPGFGPVRAVWRQNNETYAIRNNGERDVTYRMVAGHWWEQV